MAESKLKKAAKVLNTFPKLGMTHNFDENYETDSNPETYKNLSQEMNNMFPDLGLGLMIRLTISS